MGKLKLTKIRKKELQLLKVKNKKMWVNVLHVNAKQKC